MNREELKELIKELLEEIEYEEYEKMLAVENEIARKNGYSDFYTYVAETYDI